MVAQEKSNSIITVLAKVSENRRLVIDLPSNSPIGDVELTIRPMSERDREELAAHRVAYEGVRAKLQAAGFLSTAHHAPEGTVELSPQELLEIGRLPAGAHPSEDLISEDRSEY